MPDLILPQDQHGQDLFTVISSFFALSESESCFENAMRRFSEGIHMMLPGVFAVCHNEWVKKKTKKTKNL